MSHSAPACSEVLFRPASPAELRSIRQLHRTWASELFAPRRRRGDDGNCAFPPALLRPLALISPDIPDHRCIVAETQATVVGLVATLAVTKPVVSKVEASADATLAAFLDMTPRESLHICSLAVRPQHRRRGIASRLLAVAEIEAIALRLPQLSVTLFETAAVARQCFMAAGFRDSGRCCRPASADGRDRALGDIVVLEKFLSH